MDEKDVWDVLEGERQYQLSRGGDWQGGATRPLEDEVLLMEDYLARARTAFVDNKGNDKLLDVLRKVVAIGVRCIKSTTALLPAEPEPRLIDCTKTVPMTLLYMEHYLMEARTATIARTDKHKDPIVYIMYIVGAGVECFKKHGVPKRKITNE